MGWGARGNVWLLRNDRIAGRLRYNYTAASNEIVARVAAIESICDAHEVPLAAAVTS
jgi:hypothetical protein